MIKKILILCLIIFEMSCSNTKDIKNINFRNYDYNDKNTLSSEKKHIKNKEFGICFIFFCTKYVNNNENDFIYRSIEQANNNGIVGNKLIDIKLQKKNYLMLFFSYDSIEIEGDLINDK